MTSAVFLGTGNYLTPGNRYWNSFVLDSAVLVEPSPTVLPHLKRCGIPAQGIEVVVISHFHPDHTFGWPFFLLEAARRGRSGPLFVVGPPGVEAFLADMMRLGSVENVQQAAHGLLDMRYVEVDGSAQEAGSLRFRAIEVDHVPELRCFGYLFDRGDRIIGYSGDTQACAGLDELAEASDVLILECNGRHPWPGHMNLDSVRALRERVPHVPFVLTHLDEDVDPDGLADVRLAEDFEELVL
jgi:ribonuclease BN (tRNA processing enzyme)